MITLWTALPAVVAHQLHGSRTLDEALRDDGV